MLTFSTWLELSYSYFQLDAIQFDWELNQLNSTRQELELDVKRAKYRNFSDFWLLHYLLIESHEEKHEENHDEKHEESHDEKHEEKHEESHDEKHKEKHEEKTWRSFDFDRESWRENMIESHEEDHEDCSIKLFTSI